MKERRRDRRESCLKLRSFERSLMAIEMALFIKLHLNAHASGHDSDHDQASLCSTSFPHDRSNTLSLRKDRS